MSTNTRPTSRAATGNQQSAKLSKEKQKEELNFLKDDDH